MKGQSRYLCTLKYKNEEYAVKMFEEESIIYCDKKLIKILNIEFQLLQMTIILIM